MTEIRAAIDIAREFVREQSDGEWGDDLIERDAQELAEIILKDRATLTSQRDKLVKALEEVMQWIGNWDPNFTQDDEWPDTAERVRAALQTKEGV